MKVITRLVKYLFGQNEIDNLIYINQRITFKPQYIIFDPTKELSIMRSRIDHICKRY